MLIFSIFERVVLAGTDDIKTKSLKIKFFLLSNFVSTKFVLRLLEDGTRMGGIWFQLSPSVYNSATFAINVLQYL